jgi:ubiquinone/menaquinone biosynthesis C-methylase UbiE
MNDVTKTFDDWAPQYDSFLEGSPFYEELIQRLVESVVFRAGDNILDVGVGTGNVAFRLIEKFGCRISGIDPSETMLAVCRKNAKKRQCDLDLRCEDILKTSFGDEACDGIVAAFALHHIPDDQKHLAVREMRRVLKPGGKLGIAEVVVDVVGDTGNPERLKHILERWGAAALLALKHGGPDFVRVELEAIRSIYLRDGEYLITKEAWIQLLEAGGFSKVTAKCTNEILGHWVIVAHKT